VRRYTYLQLDLCEFLKFESSALKLQKVTATDFTPELLFSIIRWLCGPPDVGEGNGESESTPAFGIFFRLYIVTSRQAKVYPSLNVSLRHFSLWSYNECVWLGRIVRRNGVSFSSLPSYTTIGERWIME
jgi:hypothetical protein